MELDVTRVAIGVVISLLVFGIIIPYLFGLIAINLDRILGFEPIFSEPVSLILTAAALIVGLFWILWSYSYLLYAGQGSPLEAFGRALHPTRQLVTVGPYAFTRNPMVLGYLWILLGIAFYLRSISALILVPVITLLSVAYLKMFEEPGLVKRFGSRYEHYREHVPMLVPSWRVYMKPESAIEELSDNAHQANAG